MALESLKINWTADDYYNFDDLNRVEEATGELAVKVASFTGNTYNFVLVTNRTVASIETYESLNRIESNIAALSADLNKPKGYTEAKTNWFYNTPFSFEDANRLEKNLIILNLYAAGNIYSLKYCGMTITGDEGVV